MKEDINMSKKLYGYVSKDNIEYQWKSEPTACEVCKSMNGKIYKSANDIPDRPHPNCKCWIDVLEKEHKEPVTDPIELYREKLKDRKRNELELAKLLGDVKSLEEEIDEYIRQTEEQENEIAKLEREFDTKPLAEKDKQKLSDLKEQLDFAQYKGQKVKKEVYDIKLEIETIKDEYDITYALDKLYYRIQLLRIKIEEYLINDADKLLVDILGYLFIKWQNLPESFELYKMASYNLRKFTKDYVKKNGKFYKKISELHSIQVETEIRNRLFRETGKTDCKVLLLNKNSSLANAILTDNDFKNFLKQNIKILKTQEKIQDLSITFTKGELYNALHGAKVKDMKFNCNGDLILRIEDLYNFEPNRTSARGRIGERLQNQEKLENYYVIILLEIPKENLYEYIK